MRSLRVLISGVVLDQPMGGVRRHNQELIPRLATRLANDGGELCILMGRGGLAIEVPAEVRCIPSQVPSGSVLLRALRESQAVAEVLALAADRGEPFDVLHTGHLPAPRGLPTPLTLTLHDLRSLDLPHTPFSRRLVAQGVIGRALRRAARVFTVSESMAERLRSTWPEVSSKLDLVPNAADHFDPLPRAAGPGAKLLHLGHLEPRKNLELLLRALALDPRLPGLHLAGAPKGDEGQRLRALAQDLGVLERVEFRGPYDDGELPGLLATCAAVVLPSRLEGFGIVALEAQRAGAPLAVADAGSLPEVAGAQVPVFGPDDAEGCAAAIRSALDQDRQTLDEHVERATRFSWEAAADAWYRGLASAVRT